MSYSDNFKDPRWQKKRLEIMQRDEFKCACCHDEATTLNVHHRYYIPKRMPWEYPNWALETFCEDCHKFFHEKPPGPECFEIILNLLTNGNFADLLEWTELLRQLRDDLNQQPGPMIKPLLEKLALITSQRAKSDVPE